jgi:hypothetical protein
MTTVEGLDSIKTTLLLNSMIFEAFEASKELEYFQNKISTSCQHSDIFIIFYLIGSTFI